jgi:nicotinate phosphoribosyltransferase
MEPIISSLADTDLYKLTMLQAFLHRHPDAQAEYRFICRNQPQFPLAELAPQLNEELDHLCTLRFTPAELEYFFSLGTLSGEERAYFEALYGSQEAGRVRPRKFIRRDFIEFLRIFQLNRSFIHAEGLRDGTLMIEARGSLVHIMLFEIYVLELVEELYFRKFDSSQWMREGMRRLEVKLQELAAFVAKKPRTTPFIFHDFGTRRRASRAWQDVVVDRFREAYPNVFRGTSNMDLARTRGIAPIGTMAHEYLQAYQAFGSRLRDFQKVALEDWVAEYRGDLGIALTDVVGMTAFLRDFDGYFCRLFDGVRHDSGDPIDWGERAIAHYRAWRVDPLTKMLTFSNELTLPKAFALYDHFADRVRTSFGIGTNLTCDVGVTPLNIVMKLTEINGQPVAKLSDSPGKTMATDPTFLSYLSQVFDQPILPAANGAMHE